MKKILTLVFSFVLALLSGAQELSKTVALSLVYENSVALNINLSKDNIPQISNAYTDASFGLTYLYLQQAYRNIKVYNSIKTIVFKQNVLQSNFGDFVQDIALKANSETPNIKAIEAIKIVAKHLDLINYSELKELENTFDTNKRIIFSKGEIAKKNIETELVWVNNEEKGKILLAWNVSIDVINSNDYWNVRIDALTGEIIEKNNYTVYENPSNNIKANQDIALLNSTNKVIQDIIINNEREKSVTTSSTSSATYKVIAFPKESPLYSAATLETNPWLKAGAGNNAITNGWHYDGTTDYDITRGNNVYAYDDSLNQNAPGRSPLSTTVLPSLTFNFTQVANRQPTLTANRLFATTNLFYWNNILHDITYQYGFTEVGGNFQADNLTRGGQENDYVNAEAQDGGGTNNANFSTPPDGSNGRMQMYLFTSTNPKRDGDLDNGIVSHEFGHGISTRLTGGPANSGCLSNYEQGGEGWSDYIALMVTTNWATTTLTSGANSRPVGNYALGQNANGFGFRVFPYSTDMGVNPHTYVDVANNSTYPQRDNSGNIIPNATQVHYIGEVWCSALWDMTWNIIQQVGYISPNLYDATAKGGNIIAFNLMMQGLKMQKCNPGFLDARNAILKADSILYGNLYHCAIWDAFARRGMGVSAIQGTSTKTTDQTEAFDVPCFSVDGRIQTPLLKPIKNALLWEKKFNFYWNLTDATTGYYQLNGYRNTGKTLFPTKKNDFVKNNGVSSIDVILVQNHILNKVKLNSPYKIIAADVNNNKSVSNIDVIFMKRLILGLDTSFTGNRLWAFVDSAYQFPDTTNPFPYKDSVTYTNFTTNRTNQSFYGVKLGDVNYDWNPAQSRDVATKPLELIINNADLLMVNNKIRIPISVKNFKDLVAMQYTLNFNNKDFDFVGIENNKLGIEFNDKHQAINGNISFLWSDAKANEKTLEDGSEIFTLVFRSTVNNLQSSDLNLTITNSITEIEAWDKNFNQHSVSLTKKVLKQPLSQSVDNQFSVSPNPSNGEVVVTLNSDVNKILSFELSNIEGKVLFNKQVNVLKGSNAIKINLKQNKNLINGTYFLKAIGSDGTIAVEKLEIKP